MDFIIHNEYINSFKNIGNITRLNTNHSILHWPVTRFQMCFIGIQPYTVFPHIYTLNSTFSLEKSNIPVVQRNPGLSLFGQGILIGFVDTGIDYQHPAFLNQDGSTRIYSIWDQTIQDGVPPEHFTFGTEFKKDTINSALKTPDPMSIVPTFDDNGHGTALAGIAVGSPDYSNQFSGVAPNTELVIVKLKQAKEYNRKIFCIRNDIDCFSESDILLGIEYIHSIALQLDRPLVLCIGLGSSQGEHNGESSLPVYLNNLTANHDISVCISAGNEGNSQRHYRGYISSPNYNKEFELRIAPQDTDFFFELWNHSPSRLTITITTPTNESTHVMYPRFDECQEFNFIFESTILYVNNIILEEESGLQLILVRFHQALDGIWKIKVVNIDNKPSTFDVWLPSGPIISMETYFLESSPDITITNPGNTRNPLTVTAYNQYDNSILTQSSRGFSSSNMVVPDLAAPGYQLTCPLPGDKYGSITGTGAAAAHTAGILAMVMEWAILQGNYTTITGKNVTQLMIRGAYQSSSITYPNTIWGNGQIDIMGLFNQLRFFFNQ